MDCSTVKIETNLHKLGADVLLEEALDGHIGVPPSPPVHLPEAADADARAKLDLQRVNLPLIWLLRTPTARSPLETPLPFLTVPSSGSRLSSMWTQFLLLACALL